MRTHAKTLGLALTALCWPLAASAQQPADEPVEDAAEQVLPQDPEAEYEALLREIRGLREYNALLARQLERQEQELVDVQDAIASVPDLERQLPPLLIRMVDGLDEFIERDVPLLLDEREDRVADLYAAIEDPDQNDALKLRRVLEAWSIEVEYGGTYQTDEGVVEIDGTERNADFFILGRVGLIYQTADDEALTGAWDYRSNEWVPLGSEHRNSVRQAIRMARSQIAPDLVLVPVVPPQPDE